MYSIIRICLKALPKCWKILLYLWGKSVAAFRHSYLLLMKISYREMQTRVQCVTSSESHYCTTAGVGFLIESYQPNVHFLKSVPVWSIFNFAAKYIFVVQQANSYVVLVMKILEWTMSFLWRLCFLWFSCHNLKLLSYFASVMASYAAPECIPEATTMN